MQRFQLRKLSTIKIREREKERSKKQISCDGTGEKKKKEIRDAEFVAYYKNTLTFSNSSYLQILL